MTTSEFSDAFDVLLNSHNTQAAFGEQSSINDIVLDEYEKSIFLTQAQDIVVKSYFDRNTNPQNQGFDDSTRRQIDFSALITTADLLKAKDQSSAFDDRGVLYIMPLRPNDSIDDVDTFDYTFDYTFHPGNNKVRITDVLFILNEKLITDKGTYVIVPISYSEYDRQMSKPYSQPLKKQAWRLLQNVDKGFDIKTELILRWSVKEKEEIQTYKIRYVRRPRPIILTELPDELNIEGHKHVMECELNPALHRDVLNKAVELALISRGGYRAPSTSQKED